MTRMREPQLPRFRARVAEGEFRWTRHVPSALTVLGLCCGATAIKFALSSSWKSAVAAIVLAAIFDAADGFVARAIGADSEFGAQLDSLADLVSFGIAPAMLVYLWMLNKAGSAGWAMALVFCVCCAIRLARYMIEAPEEDEALLAPHPPAPARSGTGENRLSDNFFSGVPTPAAACLVLLPMIVSFQVAGPTFANPVLSMAVVAVTSLLMVSRLPTPSLKGIQLKRSARRALVAGCALLGLSAILFPWSTLTVGLIAYIASLPAATALARAATHP